MLLSHLGYPTESLVLVDLCWFTTYPCRPSKDDPPTHADLGRKSRQATVQTCATMAGTVAESHGNEIEVTF